ncbi:single-stranded DNA-binding protein 3-like isoform X3 [Oppia nitens]|uniref:single-stranded DNA-binding protein 3-like isoform X3 n=1 Tax=Oppia nitens TaxID=1686743 RepID=UPI0023DBB3FB|nr:single-stranded DNA-binding protein 3-like isoform X3 [Oppia nitens]
MYTKGKGATVPSDAQAREKLALYVYEYLLHVGAQKAAQTFLSEIRWEKNITLGEPPGFLHSWWCVFWDLYCAAPERRDSCEHSSEAKAFHDYGFVNSGYAVNGIAGHNPTAPSPLGQMPPNDGMPGGPMPPTGFFPNSHMRPSPPQQPVSQPSPHTPQPPPPPHNQMMQNQPFMSPRYPGGPRPGVRMPQQVDFNPPGGVPGQPMMPNSMDPTRQGGVGGGDGDFVGWQPGPPGMSPMNPRMNPPRGQPLGPMNPNYGGMRPPPNSMGPGGPGMPPGMGMPPGPGGRPWNPNASNMNYSSASPGSHYGGPPGSGSGPGPGTPIMPSPQGSTGPYSPASHRMGTPNPGGRDSSGSGGDGMYPMMKPVPGGTMPGFSMGGPGGPDGPMGPMGPDLGPPVMNGMSSSGDGLDGMKNSPANGPGTPREDGPPMGYDMPAYGGENDQNESAAILKIKESMQEEAKRFEKDTPGDHTEYFMQ